jgi:hypothetical protein
MDLYHISLFIHLLALVVASGATGVTKLAVARRARARTIGEALDWHNVLVGTSRLFPLALVGFVLSGGAMLSRFQPDVWRSGFVTAGIVGSVLLFASGTYLGMKGKALGAMLQQIAAAKGLDAPAPKVVPPALITALPGINTMIAMAVAFDMTIKPPSVMASLGVIGLGIAIGAALGLRRPVPAAERAVAST